MAKDAKVTQKGATKPQTRTGVQLRIVSIDTRNNKNNKNVIKTVEGDEINPSGVFQLTEKDLDNFAAQLRATNGDVLANAIANSFDDSHFVVDAIYVKEGDDVLDEKGETIIDAVSDEAMKYTVSHWKITKREIQLGDDAVLYIADLNKQIDLQEIAASRSAKRRSRGTKPGVVTSVVVEDEDL